MTRAYQVFIDFLLIFVLILINGFFAASEIAIISVNRNKISMQAQEGDKKALLIQRLFKEPSKFLATIQVGITLTGFLASASAAVSISTYFSQYLKRLNIPFSDQISLLLVTLFISYITLVLGELLPKRLALQNPERIAFSIIGTIVFISKITAPFVKILTLSTNFFAKLFGVGATYEEEKVTEDEIRMMIDVGEENGVLNETEKEMIDGIFEFDDTLAKEVMTPRTAVFAIDINSPLEEIIHQIIEEQYSRIPVYDGDIDNIVGILYMKDLFVEMASKKLDEISIKDLLRPAYFVPDTKKIDRLFRELQASKNHMAILIDEYGGVSGIITIEDLIEEIVGNIADEYDEDVKDFQKLDSNVYIVDGLVSIDEVNEKLNLKLPTEHHDTIGGFVLNLIGNIPETGESVQFENITFTVEKIDEKRIEQIKIHIN
ncbi:MULTISPECIES: hemolysin family protein [Caloramator]|uniref:Hemolysins and related proteins containing CBS domains n=1 Tax=Caloramator australicus RC3 TaxID=857293 RepID=G0V3K1_9CLOT|nr:MULTISPECIES: hemolysin family protein [Caloramator]MDO6353713.1 hemolysin family protein [Caloramator sp. CAR-1]CCC57691.1 Hemolysins and related proteins containing CBS domains [Caloramator australicus RC3]